MFPFTENTINFAVFFFKSNIVEKDIFNYLACGPRVLFVCTLEHTRTRLN